MLRPFGAFLVVFSVLSLIVHLEQLGSVFAMGALSLFAIDLLVARFAKAPRSSKDAGRTSSVARDSRTIQVFP